MSNFNVKTIESIVRSAKRLGLTEVRIKEGDAEIKIELPPSSNTAEPMQVTTQEAAVEMQPDTVVRSSMVGYFRLAGAQATEQELVEANTVIGIIEALGLPNEVHAGVEGVLDELFVEDGQPIEYGQAIARIRR
jgi:acetyl-CoA carboxylase biotin carboxyl carrier protein